MKPLQIPIRLLSRQSSIDILRDTVGQTWKNRDETSAEKDS